MSAFDEAMALRAQADGGRLGYLDAGWNIIDAINGGVVMSVAATALRDELARSEGAGSVSHPDPLALSAYFLSATRPGDVRVFPQVARVGRSMSTGQVSVYQDGPDGPIERVRALATFGDLGAASDVARAPAMPDVPPPGECLDAQLAPKHLLPPMMSRLELRLDPSCVGWVFGEPARRGVIRGWMRFSDGRDMDAISLLMAVDAMPPVAFDLGLGGWVPTLELTAHVRAHPAPGWVFVELTSDTLAGGLMEEDARVWDSTGRLVVQSRQLAAVRTPT